MNLLCHGFGKQNAVVVVLYDDTAFDHDIHLPAAVGIEVPLVERLPADRHVVEIHAQFMRTLAYVRRSRQCLTPVVHE